MEVLAEITEDLQEDILVFSKLQTRSDNSTTGYTL
jgi:hypothetical protein